MGNIRLLIVCGAHNPGKIVGIHIQICNGIFFNDGETTFAVCIFNISNLAERKSVAGKNEETKGNRKKFFMHLIFGRRGLMVAVEFHALKAELAGRQSHVSSLMALVAIQTPSIHPMTVHKSSFINTRNAGNRVARRIRSEGHDEAAAGNHIFVRCCGNNQAAEMRPRICLMKAV